MYMCERRAQEDLAHSDSGIQACLQVAAEVRPTQTHKYMHARTRAGTRKQKMPLSDGEKGEKEGERNGFLPVQSIQTRRTRDSQSHKSSRGSCFLKSVSGGSV